MQLLDIIEEEKQKLEEECCSEECSSSKECSREESDNGKEVAALRNGKSDWNKYWNAWDSIEHSKKLRVVGGDHTSCNGDFKFDVGVPLDPWFEPAGYDRGKLDGLGMRENLQDYQAIHGSKKAVEEADKMLSIKEADLKHPIDGGVIAGIDWGVSARDAIFTNDSSIPTALADKGFQAEYYDTDDSVCDMNIHSPSYPNTLIIDDLEQIEKMEIEGVKISPFVLRNFFINPKKNRSYSFERDGDQVIVHSRYDDGKADCHRYELSKDKLGLIGYFYADDGAELSYHIHSDELTETQKVIHQLFSENDKKVDKSFDLLQEARNEILALRAEKAALEAEHDKRIGEMEDVLLKKAEAFRADMIKKYVSEGKDVVKENIEDINDDGVYMG